MIPDVSKECSALLDSWTVGDEGVVGYCQWHGVTPQTRLEPSACSIRSSRHRQTVREYWLLDWSELRARAREQGNGMLPLMRFRCSVPMQARQAADCRSCVALQDWGCVALQDWGCVALQEWGRAALQEWVVWHYRSGGCFVAPQELGCVALQEWGCVTTGVGAVLWHYRHRVVWHHRSWAVWHCRSGAAVHCRSGAVCHYRSGGCFVALQASGCVAPQELGCVALQDWSCVSLNVTLHSRHCQHLSLHTFMYVIHNSTLSAQHDRFCVLETYSDKREMSISEAL